MINTLFEALARFITKRPLVTAGFVLAVFLAALYGMTLITMETGSDTYLDKDSPAGILNHRYTNTFQADSIILIVEAGDPVNPDVLAYIDSLEKDIRQQQHIKGVTSIVDILKGYNGGDLPTTRATTDQIIARIPAEVRATAVPSNVLTLVQIEMDTGLSEPVRKATLSNIEALVDDSNPPPNVKVTATGSTAFSAQMGKELMGSMGTLIGAAMVLMIIVMGLLFAYVSYRFLPVVFVGIGLVTCLGMMGLAGIRLNMAVVGSFPVLIGLGVDYAIQFHARFDEEARKGSLDDAVFMTVTRTGPAVMYAMLATCMGFLAMYVSPVPMIRSFGLVSIIGVMSCFGVSLIGIPTIALLLKYKPKQKKATQCYAVGTGACSSLDDVPDQKSAPAKKGSSWSYAGFLTSTSVKIAKNPIPVLIVAGLIALVGFQLDPLIAIETNENSFVPSDMPAKIQMDKVTRIIGSTSSASIYVQGERVTDLDTILWLKQFQDYELAHHHQITRATSIVTYILAYNGGVMPETQSQLDAILAKIPAEVKKPYLSGSMNGVIQFGTTKLEVTEQQSLKEQIIKDITFLQPPPGITLAPVGNFALFTTLMNDLASSKETMTMLGFVFIFVFLALVYRHVHAVSPLVPIIFIVGWNAVAMFALGIAYTPLTATLGSMTIGVAAEYTILVMERYSEEEERLHDPIAAIQESVSKIGTAITVSGLATFFGFSALCLATFPIISNFGITTLIAVGFSLIGAIFIMPAVLSLVGAFTQRHKTPVTPPSVQPVVEPES
ncbi:MAG: hydrophobe/amphiphile efflux-3 (HAE3) family transporter [Methanoregula sp.]|nr:hydrophobe/amphiphile efflux-3 (HAE3) family transporter [Methanoregula sp.]